MENNTLVVENDYPVNVIIPRQEHSNRWLALALLLLMVPKAIMLIPHFLVMWALGIAAFIVTIIAQFAVLFTGVYPQGMYEFVVGTLRWQMRINAYFLGLCDKYPPFRLG
jgi:hypothetical protein